MTSGGSRTGCTCRRARSPESGSQLLRRPGVYHGDTRRGKALVSSYRFPEPPGAPGSAGAASPARSRSSGSCSGSRPPTPARSFSGTRRGVRVSPRLVRAGDEDRIAGYPGLPIRINPYQGHFFGATPAVGVFRPNPGTYDVVFDTPRGRSPGPFTFRFWLNDTTPPTARLVAHAVPRGGRLRAGRPRPRLRSRSAVAARDDRRPLPPDRLRAGERSRRGRARAAHARPAPTLLQRRRLPGDEERRERLRQRCRTPAGSRRPSPCAAVVRTSSGRTRPAWAAARGRARRSRRSPPRRRPRPRPRTTFHCDLRRARCRLCRPSSPSRSRSRGHSAPITARTAQARRATESQLTSPILAP